MDNNNKEHGPHGPNCRCGMGKATNDLIDRGKVLGGLPLGALALLANGPMRIGRKLEGITARMAEAVGHDPTGPDDTTPCPIALTRGDMLVMLTMAAVGFGMMSERPVRAAHGLPDDFDTLNTLPI